MFSAKALDSGGDAAFLQQGVYVLDVFVCTYFN